MAYLDDESSVANSAPVELYKFAGTYALYCYTSGPEDVTYDDGSFASDGITPLGPLTYTAIAVERTEVRVGTQDDDSTDLTVTMSVLQQLVIDYGFTTSPPDLMLTIYRQQPTGVGIYWHGPVTNISVDDRARAKLNCPSSLGAALVGNVPNVYYQTPCNNVLYDVRCKVDYAANSNVTTVSTVSADGKTVTVGGIGGLDGKLIGGELALGTGEIRMITAQAGDVLTVNFPFNTIDVGGACTIAAGCDHMYRGDCKTKFANQLNFNGFMFIPPDNPFATGIDPAKNGVTDSACVFEHIFIGDYGVLEFETDFGPNQPVMRPWSWSLALSRGGVTQATIYSSDNYSDYDSSTNAYPATPPYDFLSGWVSKFYNSAAAAPRGEPGWSSDPFAAGPPDHAILNIQWPYSNYIFPGDSTFGGDHGDMRLTILLPSGLVFATPIFSGIIGLWPQTWEWDI
jgi:hypothetical protein